MHDPEQLNAALKGRYEIEREVGQGGMATVYLARDLKHNRHVALKVLSTELAAVVGRERFLSEIEVTANLHHPHLLPLFDSGDAGGLLFYVMPYVEGESLRRRLERERQLSIDDAIHIATAIGSALDYAHRHGVIHRDLKPENILMHEREPLVMDFGIALAVSNAGGARVTQAGISLGTPQYMSPEQATGDRPIDARSDIYSLGAVTYELLAGEPPHTGSSVQSIMAKVITDRPESLRAQRDTVPQHVEEAVMRALAKLPADRFASAADFVAAIASSRSLAMSSQSSQVLYASEVRQLPIAPAPRPLVSRRALALAAAGVVLAAFGGAIGAKVMRQPEPEPQARFEIPLPDSLELTNTQYKQMALSRDGSRAVFSFSPIWPAPLYVRRTGEMHLDAIPGSDSGRSPTLSPDGAHVLYWLSTDATGNPLSHTRLMKLAVEGGAPVQIADSAYPHAQASWGDGHQVLFRRGVSLVLVSDSGGSERRVFTPDSGKNENAFGWPHMLPGGKSALITIVRGRGSAVDSQYLAVLNLENGLVTDLGVVGFTPQYANGHVLYVRRDGQLFARPFDVPKARFTGDAGVVAKDLSVRGGGIVEEGRGFTDLAVSDRMILYTDGGPFFLGGGGGNRRYIVRRAAALQAPSWLQVPQLMYLDVRGSPDGSMLALTIQDSTSSSRTDIHIYTFATGNTKRLTRDGQSSHPVWTPDGKRVVFRVTDPGSKPVRRFYSQPWDESEPAKPLVGADGYEAVEFPSVGGKYIAYVKGDSGVTDSFQSNSDIYIAPIDSPAAARPFAATGIRERMPRFSPDGKWLAYVGHELPSTSGSTGVSPSVVYVRPVPGPGAVTPIALPTGNSPLWSRDGKMLYFFAGAGAAPFSAAKLTTSPELRVNSRDVVFGRPPPGTGPGSPVARWTTDLLSNGDVVYITVTTPPPGSVVQAGAAPGSPARPAALTDAGSKLIAIVNWVTKERSAPAPR
jgi:serine/threonine protein kinase